MHCFPLPIGVVAACGAGYRFDPTPNPSFREGLGGASGKIGVSDGRCKLEKKKNTNAQNFAL